MRQSGLPQASRDRLKSLCAYPFIEAYGERFVLTAGASLEADVVQDQRAIWEWLFEPLLAAKQQLKSLSTSQNK
jgi:hypothetical protein